MNAIENKLTLYAKRNLKGLKIVDVRYMSEEEANSLGWHYRCVVLILENGVVIYPSRDDEGNDAGCLFGNTQDGEELTFAVI